MTKMIQNKIKMAIYFVSFLLVSIFCFSWLHYGAKPPEIMKYLLAQIGSSVGVSLTVPENPFNTLAKQLQEKEIELQKREKALDEILIKINRESKIILASILVLMIILVILILLNFYFDYQFRKTEKILK